MGSMIKTSVLKIFPVLGQFYIQLFLIVELIFLAMSILNFF